MTSAPSAEHFLTLQEIVKAARGRLNQGEWDYLIGGTETETTLRRNRQAIESIALRPRVLRNVGQIDCSSTLFGRPVRLPVMLAPIGSLESFEAGGGASAAQGAATFGVPLMLSSVCDPGLEAVAEAAPSAFRIYQLYVRGDHAWQDEVVQRAVDHGYTALAITVDSALYSRRERDILKRFVKPWRIRAGGMEHQAAFSWADVRRLRDRFHLPILLKGIMTAEDALEAVSVGVEGVYVSNHGGRQLDHGQGAIEVLREIVEAVGGKAVVMIDGGFYRGTDIVKAIALGAASVGLGRLLGLAMAAGGSAGVVRMLELLEEEIREALGLMGVTSLSELGPRYLAPTHPTGPSSFWTAFPLIAEGY